ncbi:MAG: hypothetical protein HRF40_10655 [Nitrososphaera sp.]|jgi:hypothetical protein
MVLISISFAFLATIGMLYAAGLQNNAAANAVASDKLPEGTAIEGTTTPQKFLQNGGRSVIVIKPETTVNTASRGSTITIPLNIVHEAGTNPLPSVTVTSYGIANTMIPPSVANATTAEDRVNAIKTTGRPIAGAIDLNSIVTFSDRVVTLKPGESKQVNMIVTIPKDWPDELVGKDIFFSVVFGHGGIYDYHEVQVNNTFVLVHLVS